MFLNICYYQLYFLSFLNYNIYDKCSFFFMTEQEFFDLLINSKKSISYLDSLDSESETALYRQIYHSIAQVLQYQSNINADIIAEMKELKDQNTIGSKSWWTDKLLNLFQYSTDPDKTTLKLKPSYDGYKYFYSVEDEATKIIKYCSVKFANSKTIIKVAKEVNNLPEQLSNNELIAAQQFISLIQDCSSNVELSSFPADYISMNVDVYVSGIYVESEVRNSVIEAIQNYLNNMTYDGTIYLMRIIDAIQTLNNIENVSVSTCSGFDNAFTKEVILGADNAFSYNTVSGYAIFDNTISNITIKSI